MIRFTIYLISILCSCTMYRHMARSLWGKSLGTACLYHFSSSICCYILDSSDESNKQVTESSIHEMVVCCQVFSSFFLLFLGCTVSTPSSSRLSNPGLEVILIKIAESWTCFRSQVWKHSWGRHNQNSRDHQSPIFMEKVALLMKRGRKDPDGQSVCIQNLNLFCIHCCLEIFLLVSIAVFFLPSWVAFSVNLLYQPLTGNFIGVFFLGLLSLYEPLNASLVAYTFCCVEILLFVLIAVSVVHVSCIQSLNLLLHPLLPGSRLLFVSIIAHLFSALSCIQSESVVTSTAAWRISCSFQLLVCFVSWVAFRVNLLVHPLLPRSLSIACLFCALSCIQTESVVAIHCCLGVYLFVSVARLFCAFSCIQSKF